MSDPAKNPNPFDLLLEQIRVVVRQEIKAGEKTPAKLLFDTKEAAAILNVDEAWLAKKAREKKIPHRMLGHYRRFSMADIEAIIEHPPAAPAPRQKLGRKPERKAVDNGSVPMVHKTHDGQRVSPDQTEPRIKSIQTRENT